MTRDQLEHILRAAARIAGDHDVVVFGSQAILGSFDEHELPDEAIGSIEADVCFRDDPASGKSDQVDAAIGELSTFHETFGIYAQGVSLTTAILTAGWEERVVVLDSPGTAPGRGLCLEPHDLAAAKLAARREKDYEFVRALLREHLIDPGTLAARVSTLAIGTDQREALLGWIAAQAPMSDPS